MNIFLKVEDDIGRSGTDGKAGIEGYCNNDVSAVKYTLNELHSSGKADKVLWWRWHRDGGAGGGSGGPCDGNWR